MNAARMVDHICPHCRAFRERAEEAEEALRQIRERQAREADVFEAPAAWGLTFQQQVILRLLATRPIVHHDAFALAMSEVDPHWDAEPKILEVQLSRMRSKLARFDIEIRTRRGQGWFLEPAVAARVSLACRGGRPARPSTKADLPTSCAVLTDCAALTTAEIIAVCQARDPSLHQGTVMNTLRALAQVGVLQRARDMRTASMLRGPRPYCYWLPGGDDE